MNLIFKKKVLKVYQKPSFFYVVVNSIEYGFAKPTSVVLMMAFVWTTTVYRVPFVSDVVGVIINVFPDTDSLKGLATPLEVLSSTQGLVPNLIALLKVILITLFKATLTAPFDGFVLLTTGVVSVVNLVEKRGS